MPILTPAPATTGFSWRADRRSLDIITDLSRHLGGSPQAVVIRCAIAALPARLSREQVQEVLALPVAEEKGRPAHVTLDDRAAARLAGLNTHHRLPKAALVRYALLQYAAQQGRLPRAS